MDLSHILNHLGEDRENYKMSVSPPIFQSSNFTFKSVEEMRNALPDEQNTPFYTRGCNPTVAILRKKLAALEKSEDALVFGSGSGAIAAAVIGNVQVGDHIISVEKPYSWTNKLLDNFLTRFGVENTKVDGTVSENFEKAIRPNTRVIFLESPNSLTFELQNIEEVVKIAQKHNIVTIIDNSYCSPMFQNPIEMGVDVVVHSGTKYLAGHSDFVVGVLCANKEMCAKIFKSEFMTLGAIISPNDAWLMLRSLRTFPIRMKYVEENTPKVVNFLANHPKVARVYYPFHPSFPQYHLARKQMRGCGGLFSIELKTTDSQKVEKFCDKLNRFLLACSWGGHESLVFPLTALDNSANYQGTQYPQLIRFYVGLEAPEFLIEDLEQALEVV